MNSPLTLEPRTRPARGAAAVQVQPFDEHNRELVRNVHPPDWQNPAPKAKYHLVVIGAGSGGLVSAAVAASLGARVALIERHLLGGDCLNVGCVPSKGVIRAARGWQAAREARERFGGPGATGDGDFAAAMERMRRIRAEISEVDAAARFRDLGVDVFLGDAHFTGPDSVDVGGQTLRFRRAIIATGGRPRVPEIPGLREAGYLTNETVFTLTEFPPRLLVLGAGPIGCELAQSFARFGSQVTVLDRGEGILLKDDPDAAAVVRRSLERDGVVFITGATADSVETDGDARILHYTRDGERGTVAADQILAAIGRTPNVEGLGLEAAGVHFDAHGVETDDRLRTSNRRIFAVGDITSRYKFTHAADAQALRAVPNALFWLRGKASKLVIPWCTYTSPELAHTGISAAEVRERGDEVDTITVPLDAVDRARLEGADEGFLRIHLKRGSGTILGATLVAEHAGELISQVTQAMHTGMDFGQFSSMIFPYPTQAEVFRKAANQWQRRKLTPRAKKALGLFFRWVR